MQINQTIDLVGPNLNSKQYEKRIYWFGTSNYISSY